MSVTGIELGSRKLEAGDDIEGELLLEVGSRLSRDYSLVLYLVDGQTFQRQELATVRPFDDLYSSEKWQEGDKLAIPFKFIVPDDFSDGTYWLGLEILDTKSNIVVPLADLPKDSRPDIWLALLRRGQPPDLELEQPARQLTSNMSWENGLTLQSLEIPEGSLVDEDLLPVLLKWRVSEPIEQHLTSFVHLVDSEGQILGQIDRTPGNGRWPTSSWLPGDTVSEIYQLELSGGNPLGCYGLRFGFYDALGNLAMEASGKDFAFLPAVVDLGGC